MIIWIKNNLFVDKDEGDDNASSDKDVPTENRLQVPQNVVHCSSLQWQIDLENFSLRHGPTKNLGDNATVKAFLNQFLGDDYLDHIINFATP